MYIKLVVCYHRLPVERVVMDLMLSELYWGLACARRHWSRVWWLRCLHWNDQEQSQLLMAPWPWTSGNGQHYLNLKSTMAQCTGQLSTATDYSHWLLLWLKALVPCQALTARLTNGLASQQCPSIWRWHLAQRVLYKEPIAWSWENLSPKRKVHEVDLDLEKTCATTWRKVVWCWRGKKLS